ncbi:carbohydrate-binding domain-containing protein, partial [Proteiniclasticum sp.]|uniref:carbohydrate-binding domain-containing protein n=1 Tax=Proteiniclasticum sp. TaxID=2053595 RepID=UPI0028A09182
MNDRRKSLKSAGVLLLMLLLITGCSMKEPQESLESVLTPSVEEQEGFEEVDTSVDTLENAGITVEYSTKDLETSYDEASATKIVFSGEALVTGEGAETDGKNVTITQGGTYLLSGTSEDGSLSVKVTEEEDVVLILNGLDL